jgi:hypothetical protein
MGEKKSQKQSGATLDSTRRAAVSKRHPLFGWMKGTVKIAPGVDLMQPADPQWADRLDELYGRAKGRE